MPVCRFRPVPVSSAALFTALAFGARASLAAGVPDSLGSDSARVVRTLEETIVRATRLDVLSSASTLRMTRASLERLPVDGLAQALALQPGVVVDGDLVHVRGARPGELAIELDGITLTDPLRGRAPEIPLVALESAELVAGGLAPENGGGLAGTLVLRAADPTERWRGRALWHTDGRRGTRFDRGGARFTGPIGLGLGVALAGEAQLDDGAVPNLRTTQRTEILGRSFGWRADNRMVAMVRLSPVATPGRFALQGYYSRRIEAPFNPMYSLVGYTAPCTDDSCLDGPAFRDTPGGSFRFAPYNAADHAGMTETRHAGAIASVQHLARRDRVRLSLGWNEERRVTSLDGTNREDYLIPTRKPTFGIYENPTSDPFHVYLGDNPYFRHSTAQSWEGRLEWRHEQVAGAFLNAGLGATRTHVALREIDFASTAVPYDSLRLYVARAPGAYGWFASRIVRPGLIVDAGVRGEWFTPGRDAEAMPHGEPIRDTWSVSPRLGMVFPLSIRNAVQMSYVRIVQPPSRDFLYDNRDRRIDPRRPQGNPNLEPATSIAYEASLKHRRDEKWTGRATLFYRDLFRQISARSVPLRYPSGLPTGTYVLRYASADAGRAQGLELSVARDDPGHSGVALTWTVMQAEGSESFEDGLPFYPLLLGQPLPITEHPLAWDQRQRWTLVATRDLRWGNVAWNTVLGSGLPWTPAGIRRAPADLSLVHSQRFGWTTISDASVRVRGPRALGATRIGFDVRNVFDFRGPRRASLDGYPNPLINTAYDDYGAFRTQSGLGGAFWNDLDGDGVPGWVRVDDPRLNIPHRAIRLTLETDW